MSLTVALLGLLTALLGLLRWWLKRDRPPTPEEQKNAVQKEFSDCIENVYRLRNDGNHAEADAMLVRLANAACRGLRNKPNKPAVSDGKPDGERLGDNATEGKSTGGQ